jgi:hypothetical protein
MNKRFITKKFRVQPGEKVDLVNRPTSVKLGIAIDEMIFVGDALFPGGNDDPAKEAGVVAIQVNDPTESKRVIEAIATCPGGDQPTKPGKEKVS